MTKSLLLYILATLSLAPDPITLPDTLVEDSLFREQLIQVSLKSELLRDRSEASYRLNKEFFLEMQERMKITRQAPGLQDVERLPPVEEIAARIQFIEEFQKNCKSRYVLEPINQPYYQKAYDRLEEAQKIYRWMHYIKANERWFSRYEKRSTLTHLRSLLGTEDYYSGTWPSLFID